jgi:hypothetical protein
VLANEVDGKEIASGSVPVIEDGTEWEAAADAELARLGYRRVSVWEGNGVVNAEVEAL